MKLKLGLAGLALLLCGSVKADTVWDISGVITSVGNGGSSVTVDYSYVLDVGYAPGYGPVYTTEDQESSGSGSLGNSFTLGKYNTSGYVPIFDSEGDEIDLLTGVSGVVPFSAEWWTCWNACLPDFMPIGFSGGDVVNAGGDHGAAPFTMTQAAIDPPSNTPEAPVGLLLLFGLGAIAAGKSRLGKAKDAMVLFSTEGNWAA